MPEYLAPGVYVEEIDRGPRPIEGVSTSVAAFLGETERGPTAPRFVDSYAEFFSLFGDVYDDGKYLPWAVKSFFENGGRRACIARIAGAGAAASRLVLGDFTFEAVGPGRASDRIWIRLEPGTTRADGADAGFRLRIFFWSSLPPGTAPFDPVLDTHGLPRPSTAEEFDHLSLDPAAGAYWAEAVNGTSTLVTLAIESGAVLPAAPAGGALGGGADGAAPIVADYEGKAAEPGRRTGLAALALNTYRDVSIVCAPAAPDAVLARVIAHCEADRFRVALLDSPRGSAAASALDPRSQIGDSSYAAYYHPWIVVADPRSGHKVTIPPSGAVCGIYARSDESRGLWKAPADEIVSGALDLEFALTTHDQEMLTPTGVNLVRGFPGRGIRVWGARTLATEPLMKYVNVRRLLIFLEESITRSMRWVVFEPNDERLWVRVEAFVADFLRSQWREGALVGTKEQEALFVAIGRQTMSQNDIENGRMIVEIGIAPARPAEFVIFRISQLTGASAV